MDRARMEMRPINCGLIVQATFAHQPTRTDYEETQQITSTNMFLKHQDLEVTFT